MSGHTPGPWDTLGAWGLEIRPESPAQGSTIGFAPIAKVIGDKRLMDESEREANARLIAAAPELLDVAVRAEALISGDLVGAEWKRACVEFVKDARAAVAKATQP